jgi:flagellar M-ring protein FliF
MDTQLPMLAPAARPSRQIRLVALVFAALFALLAAAYYLFLRTEYLVLYTGLKPADASAIVADLDARTVPYKLRDDGATILVPSDQVDQVRLATAGSEATAKGLIGFELFNKSDMGLTDFAQKINYQRALQGELARTIMAMDGIDGARVHLAIPDRSLFRGVRSEPKAAVTLTFEPGKAVDERRVAGIQRLVAAAVAELPLANVTVLDDVGRIISQSAEFEAPVAPEMAERTAVQQYYRARVRSAVEKVMPGLRFEVRVLILATAGEPDMGAWDVPARGDAAADVAAAPRERDFGLRILFVTPSGLNAEEQGIIENAAAQAVALRRSAGDSFAFAVEPVGSRLPAPVLPAVTVAPDALVVPAPDPTAAVKRLAESNNWLFSIAALVAIAAILIWLRRRAPRLSSEQRDAYVRRIRLQLEGGDARA